MSLDEIIKTTNPHKENGNKNRIKNKLQMNNPSGNNGFKRFQNNKFANNKFQKHNWNQNSNKFSQGRFNKFNDNYHKSHNFNVINIDKLKNIFLNF